MALKDDTLSTIQEPLHLSKSPESSISPEKIYSADSPNASWSCAAIFRISVSYPCPSDVMGSPVKYARRDLNVELSQLRSAGLRSSRVETYLVHRRSCAAHFDIR